LCPEEEADSQTTLYAALKYTLEHDFIPDDVMVEMDGEKYINRQR
tara:strand:+ start:346 stop:480 length:135 start_codon:yes stop_codon:yes gene_type:complete